MDTYRAAPRPSTVRDMANILLAARSENPPATVDKNWPSFFINRREELCTQFSRRYDYQRALNKDPKLLRQWFSTVQRTIDEKNIQSEDIYNFDETGFMMGVISTGMVVTSAERHSQARLVQPGNREWVTVIQGVNAQGWSVPPFIIVTGKYHLSSWYQNSSLPHDWVIATSSNGWTTNERGLEWVQHFDRYTQP